MIKACRNIDAEIFVVDNDSKDGSEKYLGEKFPQVIFKWNRSNDGFGKANNGVLSEATGDHILFLNPDTIVPEDCFEKCFDFFKKHQDCGALGVRMIDGSGKFLKESKRSFPSAAASFFKMAGFAGIFPSSKIFAAYYAGNLPEHKNNPVDVLAGAFMMLTKNIAIATKGFDEDFFMYAEDIDLSFRIEKEGKKNYYFAETTIVHFKGESTQKLSSFYIKHFYGAMQLFVSKHYSHKKITLWGTSIAIGAAKIFAYLKLSIRKVFPSSKKNQTLPTAVIASQTAFDEVIHLLRHASTPVDIRGRIAIDENDADDNIGNVTSIKNIILEKSIRQILFCESAINYSAMIELMQTLQNISFLFHAQNSASVVGSSQKNSNGIFIAKP